MATRPPAPLRRTVLVTGFGPFGTVEDNPTARLARRLSGRRLVHHTVVGRVLPVSYERGLHEVVAWSESLRPTLVVGMGVHRGSELKVETIARNAASDRPDVDGIAPPDLGDGPAQLATTVNAERLALAMRASISTDAGTYLCNAWLYTMLRHGLCPAIFLHVPPAGVSDERVCAGIDVLLRGADLRRL